MSDEETPWQIDPQQLHERLQAGQRVTLLDCREPEEWAICRLPGAMLIPLGELPRRLAALQAELSDDQPLVVYCHHGVRSLQAAAVLRRAGWVHAQSLAGGVDRWSLQIDSSVPRY